MQELDVVRVWKDATYRTELTADELATLPQNPVGTLEFELNEIELSLVGGAEGESTVVDHEALIPLPLPTLLVYSVCPNFTCDHSPFCRITVQRDVL
jgi:mersacidin/lichenicidin family type 2 lantibiotic